MEVSYIEFQQNPCNSLWDTWKRSFMALYKPGFIIDQYNQKSEFLRRLLMKVSHI
jgi:hypothetical protein